MNIIKTIAFFLLASLAAAQTVPVRNPQIQGASGSIISGATLTNNGTLVNAGTLTNSGTLSGAGTFDLSSGTVTLPSSSVTSGNITDGAIVNADINASAAIAITKLASSAITIAGTSTSLGGSITASTILDSISSTQGTILYRGASGWSVLSPGTSGHFLKTQGAGANPMWDAAAGSGSVATDAIWDAAGDLVVGTGANTAARLAIGANGYVLTSNGTTAAWAAPSGGISGLTSTRVPFATGATTLGDDADLTFATDTLSGTALNINVTATTAATNSTTGALIVAGGIGASKDSWINGIRVGRGGGNVNSNTALGEGAMAATATGINNVAIGENVLAALLGGNRNMMIGHESGKDVTSGSENAGAGNQSLISVTTGNYNSGFGASTLSGVTTASGNTALGYQAGTYRNAGLSTLLVNPSNSIYIGDNAIGNADSETNAIVIGNAAIGEGSNKTVIGNSSTTNARIYGQLYGYPINVKAYGARGDARKLTAAVTVNGTNTVTCASGDFTSADVGKVIWGNIQAGTNVITQRTVATVVSSTELTVSGATLTGYTGVSLVIGTDDTAAIQAASDAAEALPSRSTIYLPAGGYITTDTPFVFTAAAVGGALPSIVGDGSASVTVFPSPASTLHLSGYIFNYDVLAGRKHMQGFTIDGSYGTFSNNVVVYFSSSSPGNTLLDVWVKDFGSPFSGVYVSSTDTVMQNCHIEGMSVGRGIYCNGGLTFIDGYAGNCGYYAIDCTNGGITVVRGVLDESVTGTVQLANSSASFTGGVVYAGTSYTAVAADATSSIRAVGTQFIPFNTNNNCTGISVASGGTARLANCILTGSGSGYGLNNSGTVYDVGGNTFTTTTGTAPVDALSSVVSVAHGGTGITSFGTGVSTALAVNVGSAGAFVTFNGALGTPSSGTATNLTGTASGLTAGAATTLATARTINGVSFDGSANVADYATDSAGTDTYAITLSPAPAAYITNAHYRFIAGTANTGACTININSLGAKTIKKAAGGITTDLADNDIRSGQAVDLVYDGTNMQMQSTLGNAGGGVGGSTGQVQLNNGSGALAGTNTSATATELNGTNGVSDFSEAFRIVMPTYARTVMSVTAAGGVSWPQGIGESSSGFLVSAGNDIGYTGTKVSFGSGGPGDTQLSRIAAAELQLNNRSGGGAILEFIQVAALGTASANSARIGVIDVAGTAEVAVKDEAGNQTQISPHARDSPGAAIDDGTSAALPVVIKHSNEYLGTEEWIHLSALAKAVEKLTGEKFVFSRDLPPAKKKDWATVQAEQVAASEANRAEAIARRDAELPKLAAERAKAKNDATRAEIDKRKAELEKLPPVLQAKPAPEFLRPKKE